MEPGLPGSGGKGDSLTRGGHSFGTVPRQRPTYGLMVRPFDRLTAGGRTLQSPRSSAYSAVKILPVPLAAQIHLPLLALSSTASQTCCVRMAARMSGWNGGPLPGSRENRPGRDERVLVADRAARHPPVLHVGMLGVGDVDLLPAGQVVFDLRPVAGSASRKKSNYWGSSRSKLRAAGLAVELESVVVLAPPGVTGVSNVPSEPFVNTARNMQASSMPTGCTLPVSACFRCLTKVSVLAAHAGDRSVEPFGGVDSSGPTGRR